MEVQPFINTIIFVGQSCSWKIDESKETYDHFQFIVLPVVRVPASLCLHKYEVLPHLHLCQSDEQIRYRFPASIVKSGYLYFS